MRFLNMSVLLVVGAVLCWAASVPLSRLLGEMFGVWKGAAIVYLVGGVCGLTVSTSIRSLRCTAFRFAALRWVLLRGALFAGYGISLYQAVNAASNVGEVAVVMAINYTWPVLTMLFGVALMASVKRVRWVPLVVGSVLCLIGVGCMRLTPGNWEQADGTWSYVVMAGGALMWAGYSALQYKADAGAGWVFVYMLITGALCLVISMLQGMPADRDVPTGWVWPMLLAPAAGYILWELGTKRCGSAQAGLIANLAPVAATAALVLLLSHPLHGLMVLGALLLALGGYVARQGMAT